MDRDCFLALPLTLLQSSQPVLRKRVFYQKKIFWPRQRSRSDLTSADVTSALPRGKSN